MNPQVREPAIAKLYKFLFDRGNDSVIVKHSCQSQVVLYRSNICRDKHCIQPIPPITDAPGRPDALGCIYPCHPGRR